MTSDKLTPAQLRDLAALLCEKCPDTGVLLREEAARREAEVPTYIDGVEVDPKRVIFREGPGSADTNPGTLSERLRWWVSSDTMNGPAGEHKFDADILEAADLLDEYEWALREISRLGWLIARDLQGRVEGGKIAAVMRLAKIADASLAALDAEARKHG